MDTQGPPPPGGGAGRARVTTWGTPRAAPLGGLLRGIALGDPSRGSPGGIPLGTPEGDPLMLSLRSGGPFMRAFMIVVYGSLLNGCGEMIGDDASVDEL